MTTYTIFNGQELEDVVPGFMTLKVSGTRFAEIDAESDKNPLDGSTLVNRRIPLRKVEIDFAIKASGDEAIEAQNRLQSILHTKEPGRLETYKDPEKYLNALCTGIELDNDMRTVRTGTITFDCYDPYKWSTSTKTYTATSTDGTLTANVINNGNVAVPIDYKITMNSDNGYIGIVSDQGAMQYGLVEEADGEDYTRNEQLATLSDLANAADDHGGEAWHQADRYGTAGTLAMGKAGGKSGFLVLNSIGDDTKAWNGGMKTLTLPADSEGVTGCKSFYCYFHIFLWASRWRETGHMTLTFLTADDKPICGMTWYKNNPQNNEGNYEFWVYDSTSAGNPPYSNACTKILKQMHYTCDHNQSSNPWYWDWGHCDIKKVGSKVTYFYYGKYYTYDLSELANMECAKVQFSIMAAKGRSGDLMLNALGMDTFRLWKLGVEKWRDVPNRYSTGDVMRISGEEGKVYVNDMPKMGDEVTGTKYFKAEPGTNTIEIYNSTWADDVTAEITIREAWL